MSAELTVHARELLEAEISALRAQVIALGGDPDAAAAVAQAGLPQALESVAAQPGTRDEDSEPAIETNATTEIDTGNSDGVELGDLDLLPDILSNQRTDEPQCPYCASVASIGGNRSKTPRKDNCMGTWYGHASVIASASFAMASLSSLSSFCAQESQVRLHRAALLPALRREVTCPPATHSGQATLWMPPGRSVHTLLEDSRAFQLPAFHSP
eukprot:SAG22_NODE_3711_length_1562_cov_31.228298_2_plen_213_part_00